MKNKTLNELKNKRLFTESDNLQQIPCRFRSSQVSKIEEISEAQGLSYAEVVRRVFDKGIEALINEGH